MTPIPRDARLIYAAGFARSVAVSLVGVIVAIHRSRAGWTAARSVSRSRLVSPVRLATAVVSLCGDAWGRRRVLVPLAFAGRSEAVRLSVTRSLSCRRSVRPVAVRVGTWIHCTAK